MFATLVGPCPRLASDRTSNAVGADRADLHESLREVIAAQMDAGLGLLSDGRIHWNDAALVLAPGLGGLSMAATDSGIRAERPASWVEPILAADWQAADAIARELAAERDLDPLPLKACLLGPYTFARAVDPGDIGRERLTVSLAEALGQEVRALIEAGAPVVQVDEPGLTAIGRDDDAERALATAALTRLTDAVADLDAHLCLAVTGGSAEHAGAKLFFDRPFKSYLFDLIAGPDGWRLIARKPQDRGIVCGVADARTDAPDDEPVMVWAARYAASLNGRGLERVGLCPSAGLEQLAPEVARAKMDALARAASKAGLPAGKLATRLDPRAVDARSAALGRCEPRAGARGGGVIGRDSDG